MKLTSTPLEGILLIEPKVWTDPRGFFFESHNARVFADAGIRCSFVQDNHSKSCPGTLRGLHYQRPPHAQDKLVRTAAGAVLDVVVDIRRGSPSYGRWESFLLSAENRRMLFVPQGFAHGFCVLGDAPAEVLYKCSDFYAPQDSRGLRWDDPTLAIPWPVQHPLLSEQDGKYPSLPDLPPDFVYEDLKAAGH